MKDRIRRASLIALAATSFGLLCCLGVFYLLWGGSAGWMLFPGISFAAAFAVALPVCLLTRRRNNRRG